MDGDGGGGAPVFSLFRMSYITARHNRIMHNHQNKQDYDDKQKTTMTTTTATVVL